MADDFRVDEGFADQQFLGRALVACRLRDDRALGVQELPAIGELLKLSMGLEERLRVYVALGTPEHAVELHERVGDW